MPIIGFNFTKISVERKGDVAGKISIGNNISITNVAQKDLALGDIKQKGARFSFEFSVGYEPKIASILMTGDILYAGDDKKIEEILSQWKKNKQVAPDVTVEVLNSALVRCNIQALVLSKEMGLPIPIPLPKVSAEQQKEAKK
jgi:hypothetical protein